MTTYTADQAVEQLVREGYNRDDAAVIVGQAVEINTPAGADDWSPLTEEDLVVVREQLDIPDAE